MPAESPATTSPPLARVLVADVCTCGYLLIISLLAILFASRIAHWWWYPLTHGLAVLGIAGMLWSMPPQPSPWRLFVRCWYPAGVIPPIFHELQYLVHPVHPVDIDTGLLAMDYALFGVNPTQWCEQFTVPWLTEYLQLAYMSFYFLPFMLCAPLYRRHHWEAFQASLCALLLGYYTSYLLYFLAPARGPRFYLEHTTPLHGLWLATFLQQTLDALEGIQRDAFPSGHTAIAVIVLGMAARYQPQRLPVLSLITGSLIVSTVYLRYHYVIDVVAGVFLALGCIATAYWLYPVTHAAGAPVAWQKALHSARRGVR